MEKLSLGKLIDLSLKHTRVVLFDNFSIKKWLKLLFIAWLAGSLGSPGINFFNKSSRRESKGYKASVSGVNKSSSGSKVADVPAGDRGKGNTCPLPNKSYHFKKISRYFKPMIVVGLLISLLIGMLFVWLSARFNFIWLNAVVNNTSFIKEPFVRYRREANSLFRVFLTLFLVFSICVGLLALWVYSLGIASGIFYTDKYPPFIKIVEVFLAPLFIFLILVLCLFFINMIVDYFIVPIMAEKKCLFVEGWKSFVGIVKGNTNDFLLYFLVFIGLGIASWMVVSGVSILLVIISIIVFGIVFGLTYLIAAVLLKAKIVYTVVATIIGIPSFLLLIVVAFSISLPFAVFFRSLSLYFLSNLDCGISLLPINGRRPTSENLGGI